MKNNNKIQSLLSFLTSSTCNFWAVENISRTLDANGFIHLDQREAWSLVPGGKYYITQNESAIFAFVVGENGPAAPYKIISAHSDSPGFRIKPAPEILSEGNILKLNTEVYGGPILYTWFDRPLSISGRVICRTHDPLRPRTLLVKIERPLLTIPHLAIHYNRSVNEGNPLSKQKDMLPVIARLDNAVQSKDYIIRTIANELEVAPEDIIDADLTLFDITPAMTLGPSDEFIQSGRIDDLEMAHAAMTALLESDNTGSTRVMAIFDNEETGSGTRQGAHSPVLKNLLQRINDQLGGDSETMFRATAGSFMISADNAHGLHPNYVEKQDPTNHPVLGGGPVVKVNANCKYMSDAHSAAIFRSLCEGAGVPCQTFVNHSDVAGGSTLGNILTGQLDIRGVDMGAAQWAMHSCRETASTADYLYTVKVFTHFFNI